jgi:hypothetical protein
MCSIAFLIGKNAYDIEMTEPIETTRDIDTLAPHSRNYNQHPPEQIERLAASLRQFGQVRPIVVHGDTIIAGHGVYLVAQHLNYQTLRVTQLPDDWTEEQALAYLVADNETRRGAESDDAGLAALLDELQQADFDLNSLGFDEQEYSALLDGLTPELPETGSGGDEFEPDDAAPCRVQAGDVWLIGGMHRLICGDCTDPATVERLMQCERADAVIYDPPWDAAVSYTADTTSTVLAFCDGRRAADVITLFGSPTWVFVWDCVTSWYTPNRPLQRGKFAFWYGDVANYQFDGAHYGEVGDERIVRNTRGEYEFTPDPRGKHLSDVFVAPITKLHADGRHSHEKPLDWVRMLIANCTDGVLYDPFLGSGTTIIAAHRTGRRCYGCEISEAYCEVILQRCEAEGLIVERVAQSLQEPNRDAV